ncbi:hypothetical protein M1D46_08745 [Microbacterium sp. JZ70]
MMPRSPLALVAAIAGAISLAGCVPEPAPTPTPTGFASEEEAFAAAEETYRAYIDALNARNAGDQEADPQEFLAGEALKSDEETQQLLEESGRSFAGEYLLISFTPAKYRSIEDAAEVQATACIDSSNVTVVDRDGNDVTPADDIPVYSLELALTTVNSGFKIAESEYGAAEC